MVQHCKLSATAVVQYVFYDCENYRYDRFFILVEKRKRKMNSCY